MALGHGDRISGCGCTSPLVCISPLVPRSTRPFPRSCGVVDERCHRHEHDVMDTEEPPALKLAVESCIKCQSLTGAKVAASITFQGCSGKYSPQNINSAVTKLSPVFGATNNYYFEALRKGRLEAFTPHTESAAVNCYRFCS